MLKEQCTVCTKCADLYWNTDWLTMNVECASTVNGSYTGTYIRTLTRKAMTTKAKRMENK